MKKAGEGMESLREYLKKHRLITDGAMGTYYSDITMNPSELVERCIIDNPDIVERIHNEYIEAGAKLIRTNTFAANTKALGMSPKEQENLIRKACQIAKGCAKGMAYVAGDIGPIRENSDDGEEVTNEYKRICDIFIEMEVDAIRFETFSDIVEIEEVLKYIREKSDVFIMVDFCLNKNGFTGNGISAAKLMKKAAGMDCIDSCGFNCGIGSGHMASLMKHISVPEGKYISCMPNSGYPEQIQNRIIFMDNVNYFCSNMEKLAGMGIDIIGGCCGTRPSYIKALSDTIGCEKSGTKNILKDDENIRITEQTKNEFMEMFKPQHKVIAVELDPPYDADYDRLIEQAHILKKYGADVITFADSPMGRSRVDSILMSLKVAQETGMTVMPHICCRDKNVIAMRSTLLGAYINGIRQLLLVTGDPVPSVSRISATGVFDYNSIRLMNFVKDMNKEHFAKEPFYYGGALNVTLGRLDKIMERMKKKIDAGASYFMTQPVYTEEGIERLSQIKAKLDTRILCGIMPLVSYKNANFIKNEFIGIDVPDYILERYSPDMTRQQGEEAGIALANELIEKAYDAVDGFYFMLPFNRVSLMEKINTNRK